MMKLTTDQVDLLRTAVKWCPTCHGAAQRETSVYMTPSEIDEQVKAGRPLPLRTWGPCVTCEKQRELLKLIEGEL